MAGVIRKWSPLIHKIAGKLRKTDPDNDFEDYIQDTIEAVLHIVGFYRRQRAAIAAFSLLGYEYRKVAPLAGFVGMNLHCFFVNTIRSKFAQKKGFEKELTENGLEVRKVSTRIPFYGESSEGDTWSVLDISPALSDTPESTMAQAEVLGLYREALTSEEKKLVGFLLSEDVLYLDHIREVHTDRIQRVQNGEKYVRMTGVTFTISTMANYMGKSRKETREVIDSCRNKFKGVVGI